MFADTLGQAARGLLLLLAGELQKLQDPVRRPTNRRGRLYFQVIEVILKHVVLQGQLNSSMLGELLDGSSHTLLHLSRAIFQRNRLVLPLSAISVAKCEVLQLPNEWLKDYIAISRSLGSSVPYLSSFLLRMQDLLEELQTNPPETLITQMATAVFEGYMAYTYDYLVKNKLLKGNRKDPKLRLRLQLHGQKKLAAGEVFFRLDSSLLAWLGQDKSSFDYLFGKNLLSATPWREDSLDFLTGRIQMSLALFKETLFNEQSIAKDFESEKRFQKIPWILYSEFSRCLRNPALGMSDAVDRLSAAVYSKFVEQGVALVWNSNRSRPIDQHSKFKLAVVTFLALPDPRPSMAAAAVRKSSTLTASANSIFGPEFSISEVTAIANVGMDKATERVKRLRSNKVLLLLLLAAKQHADTQPVKPKGTLRWCSINSGLARRVSEDDGVSVVRTDHSILNFFREVDRNPDHYAAEKKQLGNKKTLIRLEAAKRLYWQCPPNELQNVYEKLGPMFAQSTVDADQDVDDEAERVAQQWARQLSSASAALVSNSSSSGPAAESITAQAIAVGVEMKHDPAQAAEKKVEEKEDAKEMEEQETGTERDAVQVTSSEREPEAVHTHPQSFSMFNFQRLAIAASVSDTEFSDQEEKEPVLSTVAAPPSEAQVITCECKSMPRQF